MTSDLPVRLSLDKRVAVITGGAGLLGVQHGRAIAAAGGIPVLADVRGNAAADCARDIEREFARDVLAVECDVTSPSSVEHMLASTLNRFGRVDILVNNAANNPRVEQPEDHFSRFESFRLDQWRADIDVGLMGSFLCAQIVGREMARQKRGVIINISSEYGIVAPDQRLYTVPDLPDEQQPVKPVTYSVVKAGLHGLTLYLATYWARSGVRVNTISLGGVENAQPAPFISKAAARVPLGRMARADDFQGALVYLCSDAAAFVTGANLVVDGGKTIW